MDGEGTMNNRKRNLPIVGIGHRVGHLLVQSPTEKRKNGYMVWLCKCDCGNEVLLDTRTLQRETVRDCGCITKTIPGQKDLTGQRFGRLVCLEPTKGRGSSGGTVWRCKCDCGKECLAVSTQLTIGYKKSCGCLGHPARKQYIGKRFGMLLVLDYAGKRDGMHRWRCKCDCGNETVVGQTLLQSGKTKSCGCLVDLASTRHFVDGTCLEMIQSSTLSRNNTSGVRGVYQHSKTRKWIAHITFKSKKYHLGSFSSLAEAAAARKKAEERFFGECLEQHAHLLSNKKQQKRKK